MASTIITKQTIAVNLNERVAPNIDLQMDSVILVMPSTRASGAASWNMYYKGVGGVETTYSFAQATLGANVAAVIVTLLNGNAFPNFKSYTSLLKIGTIKTTSVSFVVNESYVSNAVLNADGNTEVTLNFYGTEKIFVVTGNQL